MTPVAEAYPLAYERIHEFDTSDASSLAYVSVLIAIGVLLPDVVAEELDFNVAVGAYQSLSIESEAFPPESTLRIAIEAIASHCFHSVRYQLPVRIH